MRRTALSPDEVADALGVTAMSVRNACQAGEIPHIRVGKLYRIPTSWVRDSLGMTADEIVAVIEGGDAA